MLTTPQTPTAEEQLLLELVNRARMNPAGEFDALIANPATRTAVQSDITNAITYFGVDLNAFRSQMAAFSPVAPLAWNASLALAAERHSAQMIAFDTQSHQLPGEASLGNRITNAGYRNWTSVSENVFAYVNNPLYAHAGFMIDWGYDAEDFSGGSLRSDWRTRGDGMQDPAGHRQAIMRASMTEVGIDMTAENNPATSLGPWVVTQNFGTRSDYRAQLLGVVIDDANGNRFYDIGEGLGGITITARGAAGTFQTTSWSSGGYQMVLPPGTYSVTFEGASLGGRATYSATIGTQNVKLDAFAADAVRDLRLVGTGGADRLVGYGGNDTIFGDGFQLAYAADDAMAVWRLYIAAMGRTADLPGLTHWTTGLSDGTRTLLQTASALVGSSEFTQRYGAMDNQAFVTQLYHNALDRAPDAGGVAAWTTLLASGASRAQVVLGFAQSAELRLRTDGPATAFIEARSEAGWADDVYRLYSATLDRAPDAGGFANWTAALARGTVSLPQAAAGFVGSAEFAQRYGGLDNQAFVTLLYNNVLDRAPDAGGLANWTGQLAAGISRAQVVLGFAQSAEFVRNSAAETKAWIRSLGPHDEIRGGGGDNWLYGGKLADTFVFVAGERGHSRVMDFEPWDWLRFEGFGYASAADVRARMQQVGDDVVFSHGGVTVTIEDTALALLTDDVFIFS